MKAQVIFRGELNLHLIFSTVMEVIAELMHSVVSQPAAKEQNRAKRILLINSNSSQKRFQPQIALSAPLHIAGVLACARASTRHEQRAT
jgi:hypothetical protein